MKIVRKGEAAQEPVSSPLFTSGQVVRRAIAPDSKDFNLAVIGFGKNVRNKMHTHTSDQVLIVTSGEGMVATEDEQHVVHEGDVILIPAGEKHWHGATKDSEFDHIALTLASSVTTQVEE